MTALKNIPMKVKKATIPTSKKYSCSDSNVSSNISLSPKNSSLNVQLIRPSPLSGSLVVANKLKNNPINPSPPISPSIESRTGSIADGSFCLRVWTEFSHIKSREMILTMTVTEQNVELANMLSMNWIFVTNGGE